MSIRIKSILFFSAGVVTATVLFFCFSFTNPGTDADAKKEVHSIYKWYIPELPKSISFASERVPLERQDVREQLEHEVLINYYNQNSMLYIIQLSYRYFPLIEARLKANGVPDDFKYLCVAESSLQNVTSRAGAVGFWQFMKDTAPRFGLTINDEVDERYNVLKATDAACCYFKAAYAKFGSWTAAAASYNCGEAGFNNQAVYQRTNDYYNLLLPEETMRYVFRIIALKYIIKEAEPLGFIVRTDEEYKPYKTHTETVTASIPDLAQYAIDRGLTYRTLKMYNPWLRAHTLTVTGSRSYDIQLPDVFNK